MSLSVSNLAVIKGDRVLFKHLTFRVLAGQLAWIKGENGAGKSTLLKILAGLCQASQGDVFWEAQTINESLKSFHDNVSYMAHADGLKRSLTVMENIELNGCLNQRKVSQDAQNNLLKQLNLKHIGNSKVMHLSAGQKRKLAMAMIALQKKRLWLLDEPFAMLDERSVKALWEILALHLKQNGMAVIVSHQDNMRCHLTIDLSKNQVLQ